MIVALVVSVLLNGALVIASVPAELNAGTVTAPIDPYLRLIARRIETDETHGRITLERDGKFITLALGTRSARSDRSAESLPIAPYLRDGLAIIPLAATARALGARVDYDGATHTLDILTPPAAPVATMTPFVPQTGPAPAPLATFTPMVAPTPRPTVSGIPHPRRTPIVLNQPFA